MRTYERQETFQVESPVRLETSCSVIDSSPNELLSITVGVDTEDAYGFFEIYDLATGGVRFYCEGGLWFEDKKLIDYDGVFEISQHVTKKLNEWGFNTSEVEV